MEFLAESDAPELKLTPSKTIFDFERFLSRDGSRLKLDISVAKKTQKLREISRLRHFLVLEIFIPENKNYSDPGTFEKFPDKEPPLIIHD